MSGGIGDDSHRRGGLGGLVFLDASSQRLDDRFPITVDDRSQGREHLLYLGGACPR